MPETLPAVPVPEPVPLEKHQIPKKEGDVMAPLREDQIPVVFTPPAPDNIPARTTGEQDRKTASHREINLMWETNQGRIAMTLVYAVTFVTVILSLSALLPGVDDRVLAIATSAFMLMNSLISMVIGYYFGRTNHEKVGGVDISQKEREEGR